MSINTEFWADAITLGMSWLDIPKQTAPTAAELKRRLAKVEKELGLATPAAKTTPPPDDVLSRRARQLAEEGRLTMHEALSKAYDERATMMNDPARRAHAELELRASEIRKADTSLSKEQAIVKAYEQHPGLYDVARGYSPPEEVAKAVGPAPIPKAVQKAADALAIRNPGLTNEQAIARVLDRQPELYRQWRDQESK